MLTIAITALNDAANIGELVRVARAHPSVREVIVVDDGSIDDTVRLASAAGARVITSSLLGKGPSMRDALDAADSEYILYLDGDMRRQDPALIDRMLAPFERGADFVKARFVRTAGRITELTARPLLRMLFPELSHFGQPLGGIVAARCDLLRRLRFEDGYGVDVGLLIDAHFLGTAVVEVDVGMVERDSKPLHGLGKIAMDVRRAILRRAEIVGRLRPDMLALTMEHERQLGSELDTLAGAIEPGGKLALFDLDGALLGRRFFAALAQRVGCEKAVSEPQDGSALDAAAGVEDIAAALRGVPQQSFFEVAKSMPLRAGAADVVVGLRRMGYRVGVIADSCFTAAETVRKRVFADFAIGHVLTFSDGVATGEVRINELFQHSEGCGCHSVCQRNALSHLEDIAGVPFHHVITVGDGDGANCLTEAADAGFVFHASTALRPAGKPITTLGEVLAWLAYDHALN